MNMVQEDAREEKRRSEEELEIKDIAVSPEANS